MTNIIRDSQYSEDKTPRWNYWKQLKFISLEDAIFLSLDINPHMIPPLLEENMLSYSDEIDERTAIASNWSDSSDWYLGKNSGIRSIDKVELIGFVSWVCRQMKWEVPTKFTELAGLEQETRLDKEESEKPLSNKERNNLLKLIGALHEIIIVKGLYKSEEELKEYLETEYQPLSSFSKRNLDTKFILAKKAINQKD